MSIESFFDHTCDIYHVRSEGKSPGFGLPSSQAFSYGKEPDESGVMCHFSIKSSTVSVTQTEPANVLDAKIKLSLPIGTDIRLNDKIVWLENGTEYTAELPRNVRNHHLFAFVRRTEPQRHL